VLEDDIFCDLPVKTTPRLGNARPTEPRDLCAQFFQDVVAQFTRGFIVCRQEIANELADIKMLTSITTSQFTERLVYLMLVDGHYRKYLSRLHGRLGGARLNVMRAFDRIGLESFVSLRTACSCGRAFPISRIR
jgi:DNA-binding transcriptional MocR family regulator